MCLDAEPRFEVCECEIIMYAGVEKLRCFLLETLNKFVGVKIRVFFLKE